ncbi:hypothetical protein [Nonomuraea fuscirosea]|uniref:hypothetical protein n=1 Tax=Nonomuraea fuscirosea TaxID=1291556 RepID=UPI00343C7952
MLSLKCAVDGEQWSAAQLATVEHARHQHVLHDLKRLGGPVALTHDEIDLLDAGAAREASVAARAVLDVEDIRKLYADQLRASDRMWAAAGDNTPAGEPQRQAVAELTITGLSPHRLRGDSLGQAMDYPRLNPDHFIMTGRDDERYIIETFGMYGGPTEVQVVADPAWPSPVEPTPGYDVLVSGYAIVVGLKMPAFHQIKSTDDGLTVKLGAFFPPRTPDPIVTGHGLHMAIEFWAMAQIIAGE